MNEERGKASSLVHPYGTNFERSGIGVGSGRFNDPDSRENFEGLYETNCHHQNSCRSFPHQQKGAHSLAKSFSSR